MEAGDEVRFVTSADLQGYGDAKVLSTREINSDRFEVTLDRLPDGGIVFEDNVIETYHGKIVEGQAIDGLVLRNNTIRMTDFAEPYDPEMASFAFKSGRNLVMENNRFEGKVNVMVGCFEAINPQGDYGNSTLVFNREGEIIGRYFKAYQAVGEMPHCWPPKPDDPEWMMTPDEKTPVFDLDCDRVDILTCYDGYFPELFRLLSLKGAEIIVWPNARGGSVEDYIVRTNLHQNYVHMVTTNKAVGAGTMIAAWPNHIIQHLTEAKEGYIIAELDLTGLRQARIHSREFRQRRAAMFADLAKDWPVAEAYGVKPSDLAVPRPRRRQKPPCCSTQAWQMAAESYQKAFAKSFSGCFRPREQESSTH